MEEISRKRKYQPTIMSAVDELQRAYRALNKLYYNDELEDVVITVQSDTSRRAYAWITCGKLWKDNKETEYHEINIVAEFLNREPEAVIASLLHEMAHLWNMQQGLQDTSRGGTYHNKWFRMTAESHGLNVEHHKTYGWTITKPNLESIAWVKENIRKGCFRMQRKSTWKDGTPKTTGGEDESGKPVIAKKGKTNILRYHCPKCGLVIRASKNIDGKLECLECAQVMIQG